jgi:hypothetical protein
MYVYPASLGERFILFHSTPFVKSLEQSLTLMRLLANDEIQEFCQVNYGVSFPVLGKIDVNGDKADPAFEWLKNEKPGLMGDGKVKGRWASTKKPEDLKADIEKEIKAGKA